METFEIRSWLNAEGDRVWSDMLTPGGVNDELRPWLSMTLPKALHEANLEDVPLNTSLGRSWILLFGFVPFEFDHISLKERGPRRFVESSTMLTQRTWRHEREVISAQGGCWVRDRLGWTPRAPGFGLLASIVIPKLFQHRHRRLIRRYGGRTDTIHRSAAADKRH